MTEVASLPNSLLESTERLTLNGERHATESNAQHTHEQNSSQDASHAQVAPTHPLENEWCFWYDKRPLNNKRTRGEQETYESNLREIGEFGTVEDFWRYYNHMMKPSKIETNSNYHFFKKGIKPMWEDSNNVKGGKWVILVKGDRGMVDTIWENVVLALIGETLDANDEICGAVFSRRKAGDRIAVWNRNRDNSKAVHAIGDELKKILGTDAGKLNTSYQHHEDSIKTGNSYTNPSRYNM